MTSSRLDFHKTQIWPTGRVRSYLAAGCQVSQDECLVSWSTHRTNPGQCSRLLLPASFGRGWHHNHVGRTISVFFVCNKKKERKQIHTSWSEGENTAATLI